MWILVAVIAIILGFVVLTYNSLVSLRIQASTAWSDIDVQLKRRHDIVPNLVATVQGYASHEKSVFEDVARLRSQAMQLEGAEQSSQTEAQFTQAIKSLFAVAESYPELKADENFRNLQTQLTEIEDTIQSARRYYNAVVRDFNIKREVFPSNLIGDIFHFARLSYFQIEDDECEPVPAKFS